MMSTSGLFQIGFLIFIISGILLAKTVVGETYAECEGVPERTFTGHSMKCSGYIFCNGEESFEGECEDGEYFNAEDGVCDAKEFVYCKLDQGSSSSNPTTTILSTTRVTSRSTSPTTSSIVTITTLATKEPLASTTKITTESIPIYNTETSITDTMPTSSNTFNTSQSIFSTSESTTSQSSSTSASPSIMCPHMENPNEIIFLSHKTSCSAYYVCINSMPFEMFCSRMLHFNVKTGKCDYPENVKCLSSYSQPKEQCRRNIVDFYPHTDNCNYYYLCQSGFLMLEQCPLSYGWDIEKRTCVALSKAKCFNQAAV